MSNPLSPLGVIVLLALGLVSIRPEAGAQTEAEWAAKRRTMVSRQIASRGVRDTRVLTAMTEVPRHLFVPAEYRSEAYEDTPLPIGFGQTISQPYIVGLMTECLSPKPADKVLEIGTGSGYQAAVLARIVSRVFTVEIHEELARRAQRTLRDLGLVNVEVRHGDGFFGWPEQAPFDGVIVTCAVPEVPPALFDQLAEGGRLVIPLGDPGSFQWLTVVTKKGGRPRAERVLDVRFVPMTGEALKKKLPSAAADSGPPR